jgi:two-component system, NarL family, sensor kinase
MRPMATAKVRMNRAGPTPNGERAKWLDRVDLTSFFVRAPAALVLLDPELKVLMASEHLAESCGYSLREVLGKKPSELLPFIAPRVEQILQRVARTGRPRLNFEIAGELPTSPGVVRYWQASCFPAARARDGRFAIGVISTETSNTNPKSLMPRLESRLREVLDLAHVGTWESNFLTGHDVWSRQLYDIFGLDSETSSSYELLRALVHPEDRELLDSGRARFLADHLPFDLPLRVIRPDGEGRVIRCCGTVVETPEGKPAGIVGIIQDLTNQFEAERTPRESETRMETLLGSSDEVVTEISTQGTVLNLWTGNDQLLIRPREDILGKSVEQMLSKKSFCAWHHALKRVSEHGVTEYLQYPLEVRAGVRWFSSKITPILSGDGAVKSLCVLSRDITARRTTEQTLHQLSIRLLNIQDEEHRRTAQFLHEATAQSLLAVKLNLQAATRDESVCDEVRNNLIDSLDLVEGAMQEIRTLSYVLHPPMLDEAGLAAALRWYVKGFSERGGISVALYLADDFGRLPGEFEMMMFRVVTESLSNIHRHSGSTSAAIRLERKPREVVLEIEDWGRGIPPERLIIAESGVLGVGIAGMHERVQYLGGKMMISSKEGSGTTIRIVLPVANATLVAAAGA